LTQDDAVNRFQQRFWARGRQRLEAPQQPAHISTTTAPNRKWTTYPEMGRPVENYAAEIGGAACFLLAAIVDVPYTICAVAGERTRFIASFSRLRAFPHPLCRRATLRARPFSVAEALAAVRVDF
jgi:hypothetical protein